MSLFFIQILLKVLHRFDYNINLKNVIKFIKSLRFELDQIEFQKQKHHEDFLKSFENDVKARLEQEERLRKLDDLDR